MELSCCRFEGWRVQCKGFCGPGFGTLQIEFCPRLLNWQHGSGLINGSVLNCLLMQARDEGFAQYQRGFSVTNCADPVIILLLAILLWAWKEVSPGRVGVGRRMSQVILRATWVLLYDCSVSSSADDLASSWSFPSDDSRTSHRSPENLQDGASKLFLCRW